MPGGQLGAGGLGEFTFSGNFSAPGGADIWGPAQNNWGYHVAVDTHTGVPYVYVAFVSTMAAKPSAPWIWAWWNTTLSG